MVSFIDVLLFSGKIVATSGQIVCYCLDFSSRAPDGDMAGLKSGRMGFLSATLRARLPRSTCLITHGKFYKINQFTPLAAGDYLVPDPGPCAVSPASYMGKAHYVGAW